jgi:hypothetical protein
VFEWLAAAFAKLAGKLIRPRDQRPLDDHSFRQTNIFSKVENTFIVLDRESGAKFVGDYRSLPPAVVDAIRARFEPGHHDSTELPEIRVLADEFADDIEDFQKHIGAEDEIIRQVRPYLEPQYASILRLAAYAKDCYDSGRQRKGDEIRDQVGLQYGRAGRKLCNLYIKGYVSDMFRYYLQPILEEAADGAVARGRINDLLRSLVRFSENVHFIHHGSNVATTVDSISNAITNAEPYIALHAAGKQAVKVADLIVRRLDFVEERGYVMTLERAGGKSVPYFNVTIVPKSPENP